MAVGMDQILYSKIRAFICYFVNRVMVRNGAGVRPSTGVRRRRYRKSVVSQKEG